MRFLGKKLFWEVEVFALGFYCGFALPLLLLVFFYRMGR